MCVRAIPIPFPERIHKLDYIAIEEKRALNRIENDRVRNAETHINAETESVSGRKRNEKHLSSGYHRQ